MNIPLPSRSRRLRAAPPASRPSASVILMFVLLLAAVRSSASAAASRPTAGARARGRLLETDDPLAPTPVSAPGLSAKALFAAADPRNFIGGVGSSNNGPGHDHDHDHGVGPSGSGGGGKGGKGRCKKCCEDDGDGDSRTAPGPSETSGSGKGKGGTPTNDDGPGVRNRRRVATRAKTVPFLFATSSRGLVHKGCVKCGPESDGGYCFTEKPGEEDPDCPNDDDPEPCPDADGGGSSSSGEPAPDQRPEPPEPKPEPESDPESVQASSPDSGGSSNTEKDETVTDSETDGGGTALADDSDSAGESGGDGTDAATDLDTGGSSSSNGDGTATPENLPVTYDELEGVNEDGSLSSCGKKVTGAQSVKVAFVIDVLHNTSIVNTSGVEDYFNQNAFKSLGFCEADSRRRSRSLLLQDIRHRLLQNASVIGAEQCGDFQVSTDPWDPCDSLPAADQDEECDQYLGSICTYCDADTPSDDVCWSLGLEAVKNSIDGLVDKDKGINGIVFRGGDMASSNIGGGGAYDGTGEGSDEGPDAIIGIQSDDGGNRGLTPTGKGLIAGAVIGVLLVALLAFRKQRYNQTTKDVGFIDDEDMFSTGSFSDKNPLSPGDSLDGTEIMSDGGSPRTPTSRWRKSRAAHIVGEDDSVLTGPAMDMSQLADHSPSHRGAADVHGASGVDVHHCTSATCEICSARKQDPTFVSSALEEIEIDVGGDDVNTSINSGLSYASRTYPMEDTVDF